MKQKLLIFFLFGVLAMQTAFAQNRKITGVVTGSDDGQPLPGVSVQVTGTKIGTQTNADGFYSLSVPSNAKSITFTYIGFIQQTLQLSSSYSINVKLISDSKALNEVVVVGYGTESKRTVTGAITKVTAQNIADRPVTGLDQALQGQAAGVSVTSSSGTPGGAVTVRIRGTSTLSAGSQPLYVIDGVPVNTGSYAQLGFGNMSTSALNDINPNDIESIEILKDAAASAIYGSRASNGVVIVTTKKGKIGKTNVDLDYYTGIQQATKRINPITGPEYVQLLKDELVNRYGATTGAGYLANSFGYTNDPSTYPTTNWQNQVFKNAPISNYNISINGGSDKTRFNMAGGYLNQQGIIRGSDYKRFNFRLNLDQNISDKFKVGTSTTFNNTTQDRINNDNNIYGVLSSAILETSAISIYNTDGTYKKDVNSSVENPVAAYKEPFNLTTNGRLLSNVYGEYKIIPSLTFRTSFGADYIIYHERRFLPTTLNAGGTTGSGTESYTSDLNLLNENTLTFNKAFGDHTLNVLAGEAWQKDNYESILAGGTTFPGNSIYRLSAAAVKTTATSSGTSSTLASLFGRVNYSFKQRYIISASIRSDGSSRFGANNRYGYFPAFSGSWIVSDESFLKNINFLSIFKLRGSWGKTGNYNIGDFASRTLIASGYNYNQIAGLAPSQLGTPDLTWEKTTQTDIAADLGFLKDRITLSVDLYNKKTTNLLASLPLPGSTGFTGYTANAGTVRNKGIEIDLQTVNIKSNAVTWTTNFNIAFNRNTILALANNNASYAAGFASWVQVGQSIGSFRGYKVAGIFQTQAEIDALNATAKTKTGSTTALYQVAATSPGDIKYVDVNGDGVITAADQQILGSAQPIFTGGFNNTVRYKSFDLSLLWQFSYGNKELNFTEVYAAGMNSVFGQFAEVLNRWTPSNTDTDVPRAVYGDPNSNTRNSDRFIQNGSYLRLKNLNFGYTIPQSIASKIYARRLRIYVAAQNLVTITKYKGFDPELSTFNDNALSMGTDFLTTPQAKTFTFGVNFGF